LIVEESADFPQIVQISTKKGLKVLRKWDAKRNIAREQYIQATIIQHKEDLLSQIALLNGVTTFRQQELEQHC